MGPHPVWVERKVPQKMVGEWDESGIFSGRKIICKWGYYILGYRRKIANKAEWDSLKILCDCVVCV